MTNKDNRKDVRVFNSTAPSGKSILEPVHESNAINADMFGANRQEQKISNPEQKIYTIAELLRTPLPEQPYLVDKIFRRVGLFSIIGGSDGGKSTMLRQLAINIVTGTPFLSFETHSCHHNVLMILTEDDASNIHETLNKQCNGYDIAKLENVHIIFSPEEPLKEVTAFAESNPLDAIIVDCWSDVSGCDPKDNGRVRNVLNQWNSLAVKCNCAIIFLHHTGKATDNRMPSKHNSIGAQSFEAKMRVVLELRADPDSFDNKLLTIVKGNYLPPEDKSESMRLQFKNFIFSDTGERIPIDTIGQENEVRAKQMAEARKLSKEGKSQRQIAEILGVGKSTIDRWLK